MVRKIGDESIEFELDSLDDLQCEDVYTGPSKEDLEDLREQFYFNDADEYELNQLCGE